MDHPDGERFVLQPKTVQVGVVRTVPVGMDVYVRGLLRMLVRVHVQPLAPEGQPDRHTDPDQNESHDGFQEPPPAARNPRLDTQYDQTMDKHTRPKSTHHW